MRTAIIVFAAILLVVFLGGGVNVGSQPLFGHIDSVLGTNILMDFHYTFFSFLYRGGSSVDDGLGRTESDMREFGERPVGIDNKAKYRQLDEASTY